MSTIKGWTALTQTISGDELVWKVEDGKEYMPEIFRTEKDAWKAIAQHQIYQMEEFIADERDWDETDWQPTVYPAVIEIEDGKLTVWAQEDKKLVLIETTIEQWQTGL